MHRYVDGDAEVPVSTVFLLRDMLERGIAPKVPRRPRPVVAEHPTPTIP